MMKRFGVMARQVLYGRGMANFDESHEYRYHARENVFKPV